MRKLIAAINMTLDGFCDHTVMTADDELHEHYNELLSHAGTLLYGRITYQMMESYWPMLVENPSGNKPTDQFAVLIDDIEKVGFSSSLQEVTWQHTTLKKEIVKEEILALKKQTGRDILAGSPSLIAALTKLDLIDEFQLCVHPVIAGKGLTLFKDLSHLLSLQLLKTKNFGSGAVVLYYKPA